MPILLILLHYSYFFTNTILNILNLKKLFINTKNKFNLE